MTRRKYHPLVKQFLDCVMDCVYCSVFLDEETGRHIDHIIPISKQGTNQLNNLTVACRRCNVEKSNLLIHDYWYKCHDRREAHLNGFINNKFRLKKYLNRNSFEFAEKAYFKMIFHYHEFNYYNKVVYSLVNNRFYLNDRNLHHFKGIGFNYFQNTSINTHDA